MIQLRGITWDHRRGYKPLEQAARDFQKMNPEVNIEWDRRSLKDFGDYPIIPLAEKYDMIMLDHPFIGTAVANRALVPLDEWLPADFLGNQAENSVGRSYESYSMDGHQWALAVDAAAQVSAYKKQVLDSLGHPLPKTWEDVLALAGELPKGNAVGIPWGPTDAYCTFVSICANIGSDGMLSPRQGLHPDVAAEAVGIMQRLAMCIHPASFGMNPIRMLDAMQASDEIVYIPLVFGYSNYSRIQLGDSVIHFGNIPSAGKKPSGALLGGVGLAVSAYSKHIPQAVQFAQMVAGEQYQKTVFFDCGGQPGHRAAWLDNEVNRKSNGFFENTLETLDLSYLRPRFSGYDDFQVKAGEMIHRYLKDYREGNGAISAAQLVRQLNQYLFELKKQVV